ncbi:hypothetical protein AAC387_Pa07g1433 [Persea americana]
MAAFATADICDANEQLLESGDLQNLLVKGLLETGWEGRVLVIDGGGSMRRGMVEGYLAQLAQNMGWSGILVNGCVRDVEEINDCDIGIRTFGICSTEVQQKPHW